MDRAPITPRKPYTVAQEYAVRALLASLDGELFIPVDVTSSEGTYVADRSLPLWHVVLNILEQRPDTATVRFFNGRMNRIHGWVELDRDANGDWGVRKYSPLRSAPEFARAIEDSGLDQSTPSCVPAGAL